MSTGIFSNYSGLVNTAILPIYPSIANLPSTSIDGSQAVTLDTHDVYVYNAATPGWVAIGGSGFVTGTGVANQVAFWSGTSVLTGGAGLTYASGNLSLGGSLLLDNGSIYNTVSNGNIALSGDTSVSVGGALLLTGASGSPANSVLIKNAGTTTVTFGTSSAVFTSLAQFNNNSSLVAQTLGNSSGSNGTGLIGFANKAASGFYNWAIGAQFNISGGFEITPSTATDGDTFSVPVFVANQSGSIQLGPASGTPTHAINTATAAAASGALTLTNGPTGKSGNPAGYISISINGATHVIPYW